MIPAAALLAVVSLAVSSCGGGDEQQNSGGGGADFAALKPLFSAEFGERREAASAEMVALGNKLYHDESLSLNKNLSCASCHDLARFGQDNQPTSPGSTGERGGRSSPPSVNAFRQLAQFWDGRAADVEAQAQGPVLNPIEHGFAEERQLLDAIAANEEYVAAFASLFPDSETAITLAHFGAAVGAFERTLTTRSRFDDWLDGKADALSDAELAGLKTFVDVGCATCHMGRTVGGGMYQKLGLVEAYETADKGRGELTGNAAEDYYFKVPMLLNVAETAPYLHDGSVKTLEEAVKLMAKHQLGKELSADRLQSIITFLKALTGKPQW